MKREHNKDMNHLAKAELETLIHKPMPNERIERIRDVLAFCCRTGLAFTDADHLRQEPIGADDSGQLWSHKPKEKTASMSRIPLRPHPVQLLQKYGHDPICRQRGKLLPVPSNSQMVLIDDKKSDYMQYVGELCFGWGLYANPLQKKDDTFSTGFRQLKADLSQLFNIRHTVSYRQRRQSEYSVPSATQPHCATSADQ